MELKDFMNMNKLQEIQNNFSEATGLAAIAVGKNGEYITEGSNFTDFCMKYTRGSKEGNRRCVKCDNECSGTYFCHAGLMDFSVDIVVNGEKMGAIIGGRYYPNSRMKRNSVILPKNLELTLKNTYRHFVKYRSVLRREYDHLLICWELS